jgi:hypothetical protein
MVTSLRIERCGARQNPAYRFAIKMGASKEAPILFAKFLRVLLPHLKPNPRYVQRKPPNMAAGKMFPLKGSAFAQDKNGGLVTRAHKRALKHPRPF